MSTEKVYIGVAHGGADAGAIGNGFRESDLALRVSLHCDKALRNSGIATMISRISDVSFPSTQKIPQANAFKPDVCLDIHFNSSATGSGNGVESFYTPNNAEEAKLANILCAGLSKLGLANRGAKPSQGAFSFGMVLNTTGVSNLVECAFINSPIDKKYYDTEEKLELIGRTIAKGVCEYLGVEFVDALPEKTGLYAVVKQVIALRDKDNARSEAGIHNRADPNSFYYVVSVDEIKPLRL